MTLKELRDYVKQNRFLYVILRPVFLALNPLRDVIEEMLAEYYIVSFPKSGRTWVRAFLGHYFSFWLGVPFWLEFDEVLRMHKKIPRVSFTHGSHTSESLDGIRKAICKTRGEKVLFMVRDPRDVVVSYYFHEQKRNAGVNISRVSLSEFIRHDVLGIRRIVDYMNLWHESRDQFERFTLLRYEDCKKDTAREFRRVLDFLDLGEERNDKAFTKAIQESDFKKMKEVERLGKLDNFRLEVKNPDDPESFKVRRGKVGGYVDYMNTEDIRYVNKEMRRLSPDFGYSTK